MIGNSQHYIQVWKSLVWKSCNALNKVCKSSLSRSIKERLSQTPVESAILYGAETWTIKNKIPKSPYHCYTRMLRFALNNSWVDKMTPPKWYGELPLLSQNIKEHRLRFEGQCLRREKEKYPLLFWTPQHDTRNLDGLHLPVFVDVLVKDTGLTTEEFLGIWNNHELQVSGEPSYESDRSLPSEWVISRFSLSEILSTHSDLENNLGQTSFGLIHRVSIFWSVNS